MDWVASHEPMNAVALGAYAAEGRSWVAEDEDHRIVGYVVVEVLDRCAHIEQLSVVLESQGNGIGRGLVETVGAWAAANGLGGMTLTTFRDVEWNRPLYEHLGFRVVGEAELTEGLVEKREHEALLGIARSPRVVMRKALPSLN
jgi:GNAT superfamily N-acetyltransferase